MLISNAYAQTAAAVPPGASTGDPLMANLLLIGMLFSIFYVLIWRPQQQRTKQHKQMMDNLRRGDVVVTAGGLIATVTKIVADDEIELQLAEGVKVKAVKNTLINVLVRGEAGNKAIAETAEKIEGEKKPRAERKSKEPVEKKTPQVSQPRGKKNNQAGEVVTLTAPANNQETSVTDDKPSEKDAVNS